MDPVSDLNGIIRVLIWDLQIHNWACRLSKPVMELVPKWSHYGPIGAQRGPLEHPLDPKG